MLKAGARLGINYIGNVTTSSGPNTLVILTESEASGLVGYVTFSASAGAPNRPGSLVPIAREYIGTLRAASADPVAEREPDC